MSSQKKITHGFIGIGKMAQVILQAMLRDGLAKKNQILVSRRDPRALRKIKSSLGVAGTGKNFQVATQCRYLWLGIKPFQAEEVLKEIQPALSASNTLISMMAGVSTARIRKFVGKKTEVIRIMPNTPALLGMGMTGVYYPPGTALTSRKAIHRILESLGEVLVLKKESDFDAVTGLSGSGPAFVYAVAQGLMDGGVAAGLKSKEARQLTLQTMAGAIALLQKTGKAPEELIQQVVSKGGTTEAGLKVLKSARVRENLKKAVRRAAQRSREISRGLK